MEPKSRLISAAGGSVVVVCEAVAKGEAEIGIQQIAEILDVSGVDQAGPLPSELQRMTIFSAAAGSGASPRVGASFHRIHHFGGIIVGRHSEGHGARMITPVHSKTSVSGGGVELLLWRKRSALQPLRLAPAAVGKML
jgi:hypothetical protein